MWNWYMLSGWNKDYNNDDNSDDDDDDEPDGDGDDYGDVYDDDDDDMTIMIKVTGPSRRWTDPYLLLIK